MGIHERKEREKEQRRNEIIDAAEKVFFFKGIENATMDEVAETAELSKGTLYLYFKSKEDIHFAICRRGLEILMDKLGEVVEEDKSVLENLIRVGLAFVKFSREYVDYFKVMSHFEIKEQCEDDDIHQHTEKDNVMQLLVSLIDKGKKDSTIRVDIDSGIVAHILWAQTTGVLQLMSAQKYHLDMNTTSNDEVIMTHFELVANGIKAGNEVLDIKKYFKS